MNLLTTPLPSGLLGPIKLEAVGSEWKFAKVRNPCPRSGKLKLVLRTLFQPAIADEDCFFQVVQFVVQGFLGILQALQR